MKSRTLFQLGGAAILIATVLYAVNNVLYFASGQSAEPTTLGLWLDFTGDTLLVLGLGAVYARQARRAGVLGLAGYVLLVVATMFFIGNYAVTQGVVAGLFTAEETAQVATYAFALAVMPWLWFAGLVVFGLATYRAGVLPKYTGALLIVFAVVQRLTGVVSIVAWVFALLSFATWASLGWALWREGRGVAAEPIPAM
jgi:hypothetical protein